MFLSTKRILVLVLVLVIVALAAPGCSRLSVDWTPKPHEISITGRGFTNAWMLVLAGPPNGQLLRRETPEVWATVGPSAGHSKIEVTRVPFDNAGVARATVTEKELPAGKTLIQALVLTGDEAGLPIGISDCMAVTWDDGMPLLRHHGLDVLTSPIAVRLLAVAALILACVLLRRLKVEAPFGRGPRLALVFLIAAFLFLARVITPSANDRTRQAEATPPLWPAPIPTEKQQLDPLDRVSVPGFRDLVDHARNTARGEQIAIVPAGDSGEAQRDAWQAAWLVWPHRSEILKHDADPYARRGVYVILGEGPRKSGATVLFRNHAGAVWIIPEGEPR